MNNQKRLVYMFKSFVEKVFLPQCSKNELIINDWNKFLSLLTTDALNLNEVQSHIDSIGNPSQINPLLMQSQQSMPIAKKEDFYNNHTSIYNRKKQDNLSFGDNTQQLAFNPNKTFGGEKIKIPLYSNKQQFDKQFNNNPHNQNNKQDLSKYRSSTNNVGNGGNKETYAVDNAPLMLASLEKLYKNLVQNQQKIETLTQMAPQGIGNIGNPSYF